MRLQFTFIPVMFSTAVMIGCATSRVENSTQSAWVEYQEFEHELTQRSDNPDYERHLSSDWISTFNDADTEAELVGLRNHASYPHWLSSTHSHYEKPSDNGRCLLVNGVAFDQSPGTLSVRYIYRDGSLRASEIHYQYWEDGQGWLKEAQCPEEFELGFPGS